VTEPLVTVITLLYNHEAYLDDYARGLLSQTYENVELIVFDDGSTDGSWEKLQRYLPDLRAKFSIVIAERHENLGADRETVLALPRATGELLCLHESDDYYLPQKLEENVRFLEQNPAHGAVHSDTDYILGRRIESRHWQTVGRPIPSGWVYDELLLGNFVMTCSFCCRMDLFRKYVDLGRYVDRGYKVWDYAQFLDLSLYTQFGYIDEPLARYRVHAGSLSHGIDLERRYEFLRSSHAIRCDFVREHGARPETTAFVVREYHDFHYRVGLRVGRHAESRISYLWLREHYPNAYGGPLEALRRVILRSRLLVLLYRLVFRIRGLDTLWARLRRVSATFS
jgi:glycosyltransferase involved in cell wall biosynthesis